MGHMSQFKRICGWMKFLRARVWRHCIKVHGRGAGGIQRYSRAWRPYYGFYREAHTLNGFNI